MKRRVRRQPGPVSLEEGRVVDNGGQQRRESPEQQSGEELGDDGILSKRTHKHIVVSIKTFLKIPSTDEDLHVWFLR